MESAKGLFSSRIRFQVARSVAMALICEDCLLRTIVASVSIGYIPLPEFR
jgi:hypothetical protein